MTQDPEPGGVRRSSYQRIPTIPGLPPVVFTPLASTSVSWSPKFRYCTGVLGQVVWASSVFTVPGWPMQYCPSALSPAESQLELNEAGVRTCAAVNVVLAGLP